MKLAEFHDPFNATKKIYETPKKQQKNIHKVPQKIAFDTKI